MKNTPLYICDSDLVYLNRLSEYIMGKSYSPFLVKIISQDHETIIKGIKDGILLVAGSIAMHCRQCLDVKRTIILNEGELGKDFQEFRMVNKFQSAEALYQQLISCHMERDDICTTTHMPGDVRQVEIVGVYSPVKRIGKTGFIKSKCREEGQKKKILLLSLEEFSKTKEETEGLSELIYFYKQGKLKSGVFPEHLICHGEFYDEIKPVRWVYDLKDMTGENWCDLLEQLGAMGVYDSIWIDFDGIPDDLSVFQQCARVYVPYIDDSGECHRVEEFEKILLSMSEFDVEEKIKKVLMGR